MSAGLAAGEWQDRNVFVTGATGLLGGWLVQYLLQTGANVVALVRDQVPGSRLHQVGSGANLVYGALEDYPLLERAVNEYEVDTVFHLGAQTIVGIANRNPLSTFEANIRGTWQLLEACRRTSTVKAIVIASSDKAYGEHPNLPYDESYPLQGVHPYDVSKSCTDLIAASYAQTFGLPVSITRCGNFYGGGDLNFNRIVPGTIRSVERNQRPVIRSTGELTRDYVYIEDAVEAYVLLAERLRQDPTLKGEAFNFSGERPLSVVEMVAAILQRMGRADLAPEILGQASHEIPHQYLSARKAAERLGWAPHYSLAEGLDRTIAWYHAYLASSAAEYAPAQPELVGQFP